MSTFRDPETLLRELAEERVPPEPAEAAMARRERVIDALARGVRDVPRLRERRARRFGWFAAAAAASVALAVGFGAAGLYDQGGTHAVKSANVAAVKSITGTLVLSHDGRARVVLPSERPALAAGDSVSTAADGSAEFRTERSVISVAPASQVRIVSASGAEERVHLSAGRIDLRVEPRREAGRIVVVETPDSEVVVHGTVFSVAYGSASGAGVTRVRVDEGAVSVLHRGERVLISTGQDWSSAVKAKPATDRTLEPTANVPAASAEERRARESSTLRPNRRAARRSQAASASDPSTLADENRMFLAALEARNRGDDRSAVELFGSMLGKYPSGKLAEEARIERMRALTRSGDEAKAAAEARRYLARHASGFARDEARSTALGGSQAKP